VKAKSLRNSLLITTALIIPEPTILCLALLLLLCASSFGLEHTWRPAESALAEQQALPDDSALSANLAAEH